MACHSLRPDQFVPGVSGDGKPAPLDASAAAYVGDGGLVILTARGFVWLTELMPALIGAAPPARAAAAGTPLSGRFEDGLFRLTSRRTAKRCR